MSAVVALGSAENPPPRVYDDVIFSSDSSRLYAVSGNSVYVIDISTGAQIARYTFGTSLGAIDLSLDGRYLAVIEEQPAGGAGTLYRLDLASGSVATITVAGATTLSDVAFLFDGNLVVSQKASGPLHVWRAQYGDSYRATIDMPANATITVSADASYVLVQGHSIQLPLYGFDYPTGSGYLYYGRPDPYAGASMPGPDTAVGAVSPDGSLIVQGETLRVYDSTTFTNFSLKTKYPYLPNPSGMTFSEDGASLYLLSPDGQIIQFSTSTWEVVASYRSEIAPVDPLSNATQTFGNILTISPDGRYLAVIGNQAVDVIDLPNSTPVAGAGDDLVSGSGALYGFGGNDVLTGVGYAAMFGGEGNDTFYVTATNQFVSEYAGQGRDTVHSAVDYSLGEHQEDLILGGAADIYGWGSVTDNVLTGNSGANVLLGFHGNDIIAGNAGNDLLDGGLGDDVLDGGEGSDTATYSEAGAAVTVSLALSAAQATGGAGTDRLIGIENLTGSLFDDILTGNAAVNVLTGGAGNDTLNGGAGADAMHGGTGDDLYMVDSSGDGTFELASQDVDTVLSSVAHTLKANVENLTLTGSGSLAGTGNGLANVITGNAGANRLSGLAGNDMLIGNAGNDTLDGGAGADSMTGGMGNDIYVVDSADDVVTELAAQGTDTVKSSISCMLGANVENLTLTGRASVNGTGNELANQITGGAGANILSGRAGDDRLIGGAGNDTLYGEDDNDTLEGGAGYDQLYGGAGADRFQFRLIDVAKTSQTSHDTVQDFSRGQGDRIALDLIDANSGLAGNQAFAFIGNGAFSATAGELRYQVIGGKTFIQGDTNGDGLADFWIGVTGAQSFVSTDILL